MHEALILLAAAALQLPPGVGRLDISPTYCPRGWGVTRDPFYDVEATQSHAMGSLAVRGQYRLLERSGSLSLAETARTSRLVRLELRREPGPNVRHRCVSFSGSFPPASAHGIRIRDWTRHAISVPIRRTR